MLSADQMPQEAQEVQLAVPDDILSTLTGCGTSPVSPLFLESSTWPFLWVTV